ncbi:MAG: MMPL family transporter, partial [Lachnospiraceae bacterium]|nr:MMPL family transporter [Lachnospiraceae bacterium]
MDSFLAPLMFLVSIGMAIVYNLGTNYFFGEVSYITKALSAVLQLGVTMDYSIFLWHSYKENQERFVDDKNRAMEHAISNTLTSVVGSSITTIAGFIALCFMSFTLGKDLGLVMAKGVVFGVVGCITILPSMILVFDKALEKTMHRPLIPDIGKCAGFITRHSWVFVALFVAILFPALYGYTHTNVYYNLDRTLPKELASITANEKLEENFNMNSIHMVLADSSLDGKAASDMLDELSMVDGISFALGFDSFAGGAIPGDFFPEELTGKLKGDRYQLMLVASEYKVASDEVNTQIELLNDIVKKYDQKAMVIGEAPCTKDLIEITNVDFQTVSAVSIVAVFVIIAFVFRSVSLPVLLVAVIEFAIFINMGIPCFTKTELPFIASIVIGTIQLGATVDYAILMTTRYRRERSRGNEKLDAVTTALSTSMSSILISAFCFFAATFGVGLYSDIDMISSLCSLMARGALISMVVVNCVLPSMLLLFDKVIVKTSYNFLGEKSAADRKAHKGKENKENRLA